MSYKLIEQPDQSNWELPDAIYWPFQRAPEFRLVYYAAACLETVLRHSEDALQAYAKVIESWELPGCQAFIGDMAQCRQEIRNWQRDLGEKLVGNQPLPDQPQSVKDTLARYGANADLHELRHGMEQLTSLGFNRKTDIDNHTPKVYLEKSPYLSEAIMTSSLLDYLKLSSELNGWSPQRTPGIWPSPKVMPDSEFRVFHWYIDSLAGKATTRPARQIRRTLKQTGFNLQHCETIDDAAGKWYQCRVIYAGPEEFCRKHYKKTGIFLDPRNVGACINPCDYATGYARRE